VPDTCRDNERLTRIKYFDPGVLKISHENELTTFDYFDVHVRGVSVCGKTRACGSTVVLAEWSWLGSIALDAAHDWRRPRRRGKPLRVRRGFWNRDWFTLRCVGAANVQET